MDAPYWECYLRVGLSYVKLYDLNNSMGEEP